MIRVENLSFGFGAEALYSKVAFSVVDGQKVGLVGPNGSGKSTLFKLLTGSELAEEGKIEIDGKVVFVPQEIKFDELLDNSKSIKEYIDPQGTAADYYLKSLLAGLEMSQVSLEQIPTTLSGGQKTRLAIARAMVLEPDILLLDEPTNFLDTNGKKWVMQMLAYYPKTVMVISHDLKLLDKNITKVLAVNTQTKTIDVYSGNYSQFIKLKSEKDELLKRQIAVQQKHLIQMKKGWLKMAHVKSEKGVRQRINLEKRMAKIEENMPDMPQEAKKIRMILPEPAWCGTLPLWAKNISKSFGDKKILTNVTLDIHRGERIALMGQNGAGKSTLIKILMGIVSADSGEVIRDDKLKIGYYNQELEQFNREGTLVAAMKEKCVMGEQAIRSILGRFLFGGDKVWQKVGVLSGGEKTRLAIAQLLAQNFNLLILDEPTTYLDGLSQRLILEAIKEYKGAILIVSHTPEFIDELKVSRKLYLPENKIELCSK